MEHHNARSVGTLIEFMKISVICNLVFGIPFLIVVVGFRLGDPYFALIFFSLLIFLKSPIAGGIGWLIARGSNGANAPLSHKILGALPGMFSGFLLGALIGSEFSSQIISIILSILFFSLGMMSGILVGRQIGKWVLI